MFRRLWVGAWLTFWTFLALHLVGDWPVSWWTVTSPIWIGLIVFAVLAVFFGTLAAAMGYGAIKGTKAYKAASDATYANLNNGMRRHLRRVR